MKKISYLRTEFHANDQKVENDLLAFVYDIPHLGACGIFPPLHILNEILRSGGGDGGMSPGAIWTPFEITEEEYEELTNEIGSTKPEELKHLARYCNIQFEFDPDFNSVKDRFKWMEAVCEKHRESYHLKL